MADFVFAFNKLSLLTSDASEDLLRCLKEKSFEKGELLLKSPAVILYFIIYQAKGQVDPWLNQFICFRYLVFPIMLSSTSH